MKTEEAQQIYAQRSRVAEFVHAWMKERCGLRQFRCRGRLKATMEATVGMPELQLDALVVPAAHVAPADGFNVRPAGDGTQSKQTKSAGES
jgi:hypothetical protein